VFLVLEEYYISSNAKNWNKEEMKKKISIVIPSGREKIDDLTELDLPFDKQFIEDGVFKECPVIPTLRSLNKQSFSDFEVIIVDKEHEAHKEKWNHLLVSESFKFNLYHVGEKETVWNTLREPDSAIKHSNDCGYPIDSSLKWDFPTISNARNTGTILSEGELLIYLDDSVIVPSDLLDKIWTEWITTGNGTRIYVNKYFKDGKIDIEQRSYVETENHRAGWSRFLVVPRDLILQLNGWDETYDGVSGGEDGDMIIRLSRVNFNTVQDIKNRAFEIGHTHLHLGRGFPVRNNQILTDYLIAREPDKIKANLARWSNELISYYKELIVKPEFGDWHKHPIHDFAFFYTKTFDLSLVNLAFKKELCRVVQ